MDVLSGLLRQRRDDPVEDRPRDRRSVRDAAGRPELHLLFDTSGPSTKNRRTDHRRHRTRTARQPSRPQANPGHQGCLPRSVARAASGSVGPVPSRGSRTTRGFAGPCCSPSTALPPGCATRAEVEGSGGDRPPDRPVPHCRRRRRPPRPRASLAGQRAGPTRCRGSRGSMEPTGRRYRRSCGTGPTSTTGEPRNRCSIAMPSSYDDRRRADPLSAPAISCRRRHTVAPHPRVARLGGRIPRSDRTTHHAARWPAGLPSRHPQPSWLRIQWTDRASLAWNRSGSQACGPN